ncbi:MAG TPA: hypothetical protein VMZ00_15260 [Sporichthya sp.]|nr:hypothetical protein [Sporichthya sp.]
MDLKVLKSQWDRTAAVVLTVAGVISLVVGYARVADSTLLAEQTRYIVSGGIGGIFLLGLGATLWISADLRDEWRKLDRIERALGDGVLRWDPAAGGDSRADRPTDVTPTSEQDPAEPAGLAHAASSREHA